MGMKLRAVIFKTDHRNDIFTIKQKMRTEGNTTQFTRNNKIYFIDDQHFQITTDAPWWRLWIFKRYFTTYYYAEGRSAPLPVPLFKPLFDEKAAKTCGHMTDEEIAAAFNPWFYRVIGSKGVDALTQLLFYISAGTLIGVLWIAWQLYEGRAPAG